MGSELVVAGGVLAAAALTGLTGYGFNLLSLPVLLIKYEPHHAIVISLLLGIVTNIALLSPRAARLDGDYRISMSLFVAALIGLPVGIFAFTTVTPGLLMISIGAITVGYASLIVANRHFQPRSNPKLAIPAGLLSGVLAGSTGLSGPPAVVYLHSRRLNPRTFRSTVAIYIIMISTTTVLTIYILGQVTAETLLIGAGLAPLALLGVLGGGLAFRVTPAKLFDHIVLMVLFVMGLWTITTSI